MTFTPRLVALTVLVAPALSQGGDDCFTATPVSMPGTYVMDMASATGSGFYNSGSTNAACIFNYANFCADRFVQFTVPASGDYEIVPRSNLAFGAAVVAHAGVGCAAQCVETGDTSSPIQLLGVQAGAQYLIQVGNVQQGFPGTPCRPDQVLLEIDQCIGTRQDAYEDNDTCSTAVPVQDGTIQGLNVERLDRDFYSIDLASGRRLSASVVFQHAQANVELTLWDPASACTGGAPLAQSWSTNDIEAITFTNSTGASRALVLEVFVASSSAGACASYDLAITRSSVLGPIGGTYCSVVPNSLGLDAYLLGYGSNSIALNSVLITGLNFPPNQFGLLAVSDTQGFYPGLNGNSNGNFCLAGVMGRYPVVGIGGSGSIAQTIDLFSVPQGGGVVPVAPGMTLNFQFWYRDAVGLGSNLSLPLSIPLLN